MQTEKLPRKKKCQGRGKAAGRGRGGVGGELKRYTDAAKKAGTSERSEPKKREPSPLKGLPRTRHKRVAWAAKKGGGEEGKARPSTGKEYSQIRQEGERMKKEQRKNIVCRENHLDKGYPEEGTTNEKKGLSSSEKTMPWRGDKYTSYVKERDYPRKKKTSQRGNRKKKKKKHSAKFSFSGKILQTTTKKSIPESERKLIKRRKKRDQLL